MKKIFALLFGVAGSASTAKCDTKVEAKTPHIYSADVKTASNEFNRLSAYLQKKELTHANLRVKRAEIYQNELNFWALIVKNGSARLRVDTMMYQNRKDAENAMGKIREKNRSTDVYVELAVSGRTLIYIYGDKSTANTTLAQSLVTVFRATDKSSTSGPQTK